MSYMSLRMPFGIPMLASGLQVPFEKFKEFTQKQNEKEERSEVQDKINEVALKNSHSLGLKTSGHDWLKPTILEKNQNNGWVNLSLSENIEKKYNALQTVPANQTKKEQNESALVIPTGFKNHRLEIFSLLPSLPLY